MSTRLRSLSDNEVYARWQDRIVRVRQELNYLFATRRNYRSVMAMAEHNERLLSEGGDVLRWLTGMWGRDAVMGVRRGLDDDRNTIALGTLLDEMASRPQVLTRRRYMAFVSADRDEHFRAMLDDTFTGLGVVAAPDRSNDYLDPDVIREERRDLNRTAAPVLDYANRLVAHRTPIDEDLRLTVPQINEAIDAMEVVFTKYYAILHGSSLMRLEPTFMGNWTRPFRFAWDSRGQAE